MIILPRQARDKHTGKLKREYRALAVELSGLYAPLAPPSMNGAWGKRTPVTFSEPFFTLNTMLFPLIGKIRSKLGVNSL